MMDALSGTTYPAVLSASWYVFIFLNFDARIRVEPTFAIGFSKQLMHVPIDTKWIRLSKQEK